MGKKNKKKLSYKIVRDLPIGKGKGVLITKKGEEIRVSGAVILLKGSEKSLIVPKGNNGNPGNCNLSFGCGTMVKRWKTR